MPNVNNTIEIICIGSLYLFTIGINDNRNPAIIPITPTKDIE